MTKHELMEIGILHMARSTINSSTASLQLLEDNNNTLPKTLSPVVNEDVYIALQALRRASTSLGREISETLEMYADE